MAHGSFPIEGRIVTPGEMPEVARSCGFVNVEAMDEHSRRRDTVDLDRLLVDICNLEQIVKWLSDRLTATGTERIG